MKRVLVFIKNVYIRDAQAYIGERLDDSDDYDIYMSSEKDRFWRDVSGDLCIMDTMVDNQDEIWKKIRIMVPDADKKIFKIIEIDERKEYEKATHYAEQLHTILFGVQKMIDELKKLEDETPSEDDEIKAHRVKMIELMTAEADDCEHLIDSYINADFTGK